MNHSEWVGTVTTASVSLFTIIDYSVFGALLIVSLCIGLYFGFFSKQEQTTEEYLQGGHKMQVLPVAISLVASQLSSMSIMTLPVEIYSFGWQFALLLPGISLITVATNYLFIPVFYNNNIDNCYAYLELRFSKTIRRFATRIFIVATVVNLPIAMFIPSLAFSEVTGHNLYVVNTIACVCCATYTMLGGIKAVVWADVVQGCVIVLSIVLVAFFGVQKVGGLSIVWDRAVSGGRIFPPDMTLDLTTRQTFWNVTIGTFILWTCHISFSQGCVQRLVALPTLADSRRVLKIFCIGTSILMFFIFFIGIVMYGYYYECDPMRAKIVKQADKLVPRFVEDVAGHLSGMSGLFVSCIFSASLSSYSAVLNAIAGIIYLDYIKPLKFFHHTERKASLIMKTIIALLGLECIFGAYVVAKFSSVLQLLLTLNGSISGAFFGIFTMGMLWPWANKRGALYGMLAGIGVICIIIVNTQIAIGNGKLAYEPLPTSIDGCSNETIAGDSSSNLATRQIVDDDGFAFYKISFMWYAPLGAAITWITGIIVSHLTGGQEIDESNIRLLAPPIQRLLPQKCRNEELQVVTEKMLPEPHENNIDNSKV